MEKDIFRTWIYDGKNKETRYGINDTYHFASRIENDEDFCERVTRDFMHDLNLPDNDFGHWNSLIWDWASDYTELCGAGCS